MTERADFGLPEVAGETLGALLNLDARRIQQLVKQGVLPKVRRGKYDLIPCAQAYIRYLQAQDDLDGLNPAAEKARLDKERADEVAMKNDVTRGKLLRRAEVEAAWIAAMGNMRARLLAIPAKVAALVAGGTRAEASAVIQEAVHEALAELSSVKVQAKTDPESRGDGGGVVDGGKRGAQTAAKTHRKRVGGRGKAIKSRKQRRAR